MSKNYVTIQKRAKKAQPLITIRAYLSIFYTLLIPLQNSKTTTEIASKIIHLYKLQQIE